MAEEDASVRHGKRAVAETAAPLSALADDVLLQILGRLEGDPQDSAQASCASPCLAALLASACFPPRLSWALPVELLLAPPPEGAPAVWVALHKLSVCCPGLRHAGVLLEPSDDFGLELDTGPDVPFRSPAHADEGLEATATSRDPRTRRFART